MPFIKLSILLTSLTFAFSVLAAEGKGGGEATDSGGSSGGGAEMITKDQKEYIEKTSKLTTLTNRIEEADKQFQELIRKKNAAPTAEQKQAIIKEMVELNDKRNKDVDQFNKLKTDVSLRYPHKGEHLNRRYQTQSKRSLEEVEGVAGLDEMLSRIKKVVDHRFAPFKEADKKDKSGGTTSRSAGSSTAEEPKKLRLEK